MIDFEKEKTLSMGQASKYLPLGVAGKRIHPNTIARWARDGFAATGIVLESAKIGKHRVTSVEACRRFIVAITSATTPQQPHYSTRTAESIGKELEALGI